MPRPRTSLRALLLTSCLLAGLGCSSKLEHKFSQADRNVAESVSFGNHDYRAQRPAPSTPSHPAIVKGGDVAPSESNAQTEGYKDYGVNAMTQTTEDKLSTFSIDVDTGSYTIARRKLQEGYLPPAAAVRVEEFVNYFAYHYPSPDAGAFGVEMEAAPSPFDTSGTRTILRIGVQGKRIPAADRKPVHLTFLVDTSGSMSQADKLPLAKEALKILTRNLGPQDTVALATYAGSTTIKLQPTPASAPNKGAILAQIDALDAGGGTAMSSGMLAAYTLAGSSMTRGHVNRVIVLSDGDANIGNASHQEILGQIRSHVDEGITLSTIGLGMGNYQDTMMEQLANKGNGNYYYIDSLEEAQKVFGEQADGTLEVIAKDVKIQVEFNPKAVTAYRLIGYENRDIADADFRDDKVDAGEIGSGHTVTALYELVLDPESAEKDLAKVMVRHKAPQGHSASEQSFMFTAQSLHPALSQASADFQLATAVAAFAEVLRESPYASHISFDLIKEIAQGSSRHDQQDRQEFLSLVDRAKALKASEFQ